MELTPRELKERINNNEALALYSSVTGNLALIDGTVYDSSSLPGFILPGFIFIETEFGCICADDDDDAVIEVEQL